MRLCAGLQWNKGRAVFVALIYWQKLKCEFSYKLTGPHSTQTLHSSSSFSRKLILSQTELCLTSRKEKNVFYREKIAVVWKKNSPNAEMTYSQRCHFAHNQKRQIVAAALFCSCGENRQSSVWTAVRNPCHFTRPLHLSRLLIDRAPGIRLLWEPEYMTIRTSTGICAQFQCSGINMSAHLKEKGKREGMDLF